MTSFPPDRARNSALEDSSVVLGHNAVMGPGGQGEILRQMAVAYDELEHGQIFSRGATCRRTRCIPIQYRTIPHRWIAKILPRIPYARGRSDLLTLLFDLDFDQQVSRLVGTPNLFEGVMGQCAMTFRRLAGSSTKRVLYALNTHILNLDRVLREEHARLGISRPSFLHPRMKIRALEEIALANSIHVTSHIAKKTYLDRGIPESKIHVIHPCVDHEHFRPTTKRDNLFRVMSSSSVDPRKGIYYLLQAFVAAAIPNSELVIIGGTGDRWSRLMLQGFLKRYPNIRQEFRDVMKEPVEEHFGRASVIAHPALEDAYGLTIPQALASGRPVIATRQSGASELVRDGEEGFLVESRDIEGLARCMKQLAENSQLQDRMTLAAPRAVAHLTEEWFSGELKKYYEKVLVQPEEVHTSGI